MLLKYTDHLYDKEGHLTQALLHKNELWDGFESVFQEY